MGDFVRLWITAMMIVAIVLGIMTAVVKIAEYGASKKTGWEITTAPGPVTPTPRIDDHVTAVMSPRVDVACPACPECPTWDALRRAGVEIVCANAFGEIPPINYWPVEVYMGCSRIKMIRITDKKIKVERR